MRRLFGAYNIKMGQMGQTLVEFALILFLLITLLFGIMEFARAWQYSNALTNGVRDGAAYAARLASSPDYVGNVRNFTFARISSAHINLDGFNQSKIQVYKNNTPTPLTSGADPALTTGDTVKVEATYDFYILTGSIIPFFSGQKQMTRQATMRYESN